jgi:hypothetical protein
LKAVMDNTDAIPQIHEEIEEDSFIGRANEKLF